MNLSTSPLFDLSEVAPRWSDVGYLRAVDPSTKPPAQIAVVRVEPSELYARGLAMDTTREHKSYADAMLFDIWQATSPGTSRELVIYVMQHKGHSTIRQYTLRVQRGLEETDLPMDPVILQTDHSTRIGEADALSATPGLAALIAALGKGSDVIFNVLSRAEGHYRILLDRENANLVAERAELARMRDAFHAAQAEWAAERARMEQTILTLGGDDEAKPNPEVKEMWGEVKPYLERLATSLPGMAAAAAPADSPFAPMAAMYAAMTPDQRAGIQAKLKDQATIGHIMSILGVAS